MIYKCYLISFDEKINKVSIFDNKVLSKNEYTSVEQNDKYCFCDIGPKCKKIEDFASIHYYTHYDGYAVQAEDCSISNDYVKDGFVYDKKNQRVFYGNVSIYATLENGKYVDVITGKVIPSDFIKYSKELKVDSAGLKDMARDLELVSKHVDLYCDLLNDLISIFTLDSTNRKIAQEKYDEMCAMTPEKCGKVKKMIMKMKKSSNS